MKHAKRRRRWTGIAFSILVAAVGLGLVWAIHRGLEAKKRCSHFRKEMLVEEALKWERHSLLGQAVITEYELTGAHTLETNRCAAKIAQLRSPEAVKPLRRLIDLRWEYRELAYELIGLAGDLDDAAYLARVFGENPSERDECVRRFVQIAARHGSELEGNSDITAFLAKALQDKRWQEQALRAIAKYPNGGFAAHIEDLIERRRLYFRSEAILAYLEFDAPYSELITGALFDTASGKERHEAAVNAARKGSEQAVRWLALVLTDPTTTYRQKANAGKYLSELEARYGLTACEAEYEIDRVKARVRAVETAGRLSGKAKLAFLERALNDPLIDVRLAAVRALGLEYSPEAAQLLIGLLTEETTPPEDNPDDWKEASICVAAASLGNMGAQEAVPILARLLWYAQPVKGVVHEALTRITMGELGGDPAAYMNWFDEVVKQSEKFDSRTVESSR